jgi:uncharacterized protein YndB with AHSA1/START domain
MTTTEQVSAAPADYQTTIRVHASADAVFEMLTTVTGLAAWWNPATGSGETGGELRFMMSAPEPLLIHVDEATRPTSVRWTVTDCPFLRDWIGTKPTFAITPLDDHTSELYFHHQGLSEDLECVEMCTRSWNFYMTSLRDYLEAGRGNPYGSPADRARREAEGRPMQPVRTSIHQEAHIAAPPQRVFDVLATGSQFSAATEMPADITAREGDAFSAFGGRIEGRLIEVVPGQRLVQAWRLALRILRPGSPAFTPPFALRSSRTEMEPGWSSTIPASRRNGWSTSREGTRPSTRIRSPTFSGKSRQGRRSAPAPRAISMSHFTAMPERIRTQNMLGNCSCQSSIALLEARRHGEREALRRLVRQSCGLSGHRHGICEWQVFEH